MIRRSKFDKSVILGVAYGIRAESQDDPHIKAVEKLMAVFDEVTLPTSFLVVVMRFFLIMHLTVRLGMTAERYSYATVYPFLVRWSFVQAKSQSLERYFLSNKQITIYEDQKSYDGTAEDCFYLQCLRNVADPDPRPDYLSKEEEITMKTAGIMFEVQCSTGAFIRKGGADTETITLETFMRLQSCVFRMFSVKRKLSWITSLEQKGCQSMTIENGCRPKVVSLGIRLWQPVTALGAPHRVEDKDLYKGYHIAKHSTVQPNVWAMLHDHKVHVYNDQGNAEEWKLNPDTRDPTAISLGFGRPYAFEQFESIPSSLLKCMPNVLHRVCPGKHMVLFTLWTTLASVLRMYNVTPAIDKDRAKPTEYTNVGVFKYVLLPLGVLADLDYDPCVCFSKLDAIPCLSWHGVVHPVSQPHSIVQ
ncbi:hypothetical protein GYMLUDRAFT_60675 [Collybiopsis luxurians FD-317 M1]|uniref:Uncharacterized protein n=1 Tax=Collybiopsis luxurians FD-317 M1 TaxID=944289 RepID=A0A0D0CJS3_9AGAR|nr:hypothetical protein GYMLUDRAFT_60675 [Collybiopsis luxurians FD-317 M1]